MRAFPARAPASDVLEYDPRLWRGTTAGAATLFIAPWALESQGGGLIDVRASPIEDALDVLQSARPSQTYHLPHGVELCIRLPARSLPRSTPKRWSVEARAYNANTLGRVPPRMDTKWLRNSFVYLIILVAIIALFFTVVQQGGARRKSR